MSATFFLESREIQLECSTPKASLHTYQQQRQEQSRAAKELLVGALARLHIPQDTLIRHNARWTIGDQRIPSIAISHADTWVQCAVDTHFPIGIDIESTLRRIDVQHALEHFLHPQIDSILNHASGAQNRRAFFMIWTMLEAQGKVLNLDLNASLHQKLFATSGAVSPPSDHPAHRFFVRWLSPNHVSSVFCHATRASELRARGWDLLHDTSALLRLSQITETL